MSTIRSIAATILGTILCSAQATPTTTTINTSLPSSELIASSPAVIKHCAFEGSLAYQTALSLNYIFGRATLPRNYTKAYAWSLIVGHRLELAGNADKLALHRRTEALLRQKINDPRILAKGKLLAIKLWQKYQAHWLAESKLAAECKA